MQSVEYRDIGGNLEKLFNEPSMLSPDPVEAQAQWDCELSKVSESGGHIEIFAGTPENIEDRSKFPRQSRRRLERLEKKANKKRGKNS